MIALFGGWTFVSTGAGFGLFSGRPRERKLVDDTETCPGFDSQEEGACAFSVDKIEEHLGKDKRFAVAGNKLRTGRQRNPIQP